MVTATLPPFAQAGTRIDVTAASIGDASNLQGGLLLLTPLKGPDGQVYAVAQGPVVTGGFVAGKRGTSQSVNHPTVGRVANGALIEKSSPSITPTSVMKLQLHRADFTTAARIAEAVNKRFGSSGKTVAHAENSALVSIQMPSSYSKRPIEFMAEVEALTLEADRVAKVVVNERTGTIVMGKDVRIAPVAILHGNLSVEIRTELTVSQPAPFSAGKTAVVPQVTVTAKEDPAKNVVLKDGATVEELSARLDGNRFDAARHHRDSASLAGCRRTRSRNGDHLMPDGISLNLIPLGALAPDDRGREKANLKDAAGKFESMLIAQMLKSARKTDSGGWTGESDQAGLIHDGHGRAAICRHAGSARRPGTRQARHDPDRFEKVAICRSEYTSRKCL